MIYSNLMINRPIITVVYCLRNNQWFTICFADFSLIYRENSSDLRYVIFFSSSSSYFFISCSLISTRPSSTHAPPQLTNSMKNYIFRAFMVHPYSCGRCWYFFSKHKRFCKIRINRVKKSSQLFSIKSGYLYFSLI